MQGIRDCEGDRERAGNKGLGGGDRSVHGIRDWGATGSVQGIRRDRQGDREPVENEGLGRRSAAEWTGTATGSVQGLWDWDGNRERAGNKARIP